MLTFMPGLLLLNRLSCCVVVHLDRSSGCECSSPETKASARSNMSNMSEALGQSQTKTWPVPPPQHGRDRCHCVRRAPSLWLDKEPGRGRGQAAGSANWAGNADTAVIQQRLRFRVWTGPDPKVPVLLANV